MAALIVYATRHGATAEIAMRIAERMGERGVAATACQVDVAERIEDYEAVVLGAPVYDQSWPPEANDFVSIHADALAARPFWLFSVGSFPDTARWFGPLVRKEPRGISALLTRLHPRDYRVFRGVIEKEWWPIWSRAFFRLLGGRFGDHRDWMAIEAWADEISTALSRSRDAGP